VISCACRRAKIATGMRAAHRCRVPRQVEDALVAAAAALVRIVPTHRWARKVLSGLLENRDPFTRQRAALALLRADPCPEGALTAI
jgi:hypothetical protein